MVTHARHFRSCQQILACLGVALAGGCADYGQVSPATYQYAQAAYSVSNRRASNHLEPLKSQLQTAQTNGELPAHEAEWLLDILADAESGDWDAAVQASRRMLENQAVAVSDELVAD